MSRRREGTRNLYALARGGTDPLVGWLGALEADADVDAQAPADA